jgi:transposase InsO family protein
VSRYIDAHRGRFGVEPICRVLEEPTSTYYAARKRPASVREGRDEELLVRIRTVHAQNYGVYGARRVWKELLRQGVDVARSTVERLMVKDGLVGVRRGKKPFTTVPDLLATRPGDLVNRNFTTTRPNQLWLADLTYVRTWEGFCYVAFVLDVLTRRIVGWQLARHLRTDLPLDALEMAAWLEDICSGLIHHSDAGCQYTSFRYTERLAELGITASIGTVADSYDNAMAEALNGTYKAELIDRRSWRSASDVELATTRWVGWYNQRRLHSALDFVPPAEFEANWRKANISATVRSTESFEIDPGRSSTPPVSACPEPVGAH